MLSRVVFKQEPARKIRVHSFLSRSFFVMEPEAFADSFYTGQMDRDEIPQGNTYTVQAFRSSTCNTLRKGPLSYFFHVPEVVPPVPEVLKPYHEWALRCHANLVQRGSVMKAVDSAVRQRDNAPPCRQRACRTILVSQNSKFLSWSATSFLSWCLQCRALQWKISEFCSA